MELDVRMPTRYGIQPGFAAWPDAPGRYPPVILYMDAPGFREELCNMARRMAKHGYFCLVPDLYYRIGTIRFDVARRNPEMSAVIKACRLSLTNTAVVEDTRGMIGFLDAQAAVKPGPIGCVGHCMSGPFAVAAAAAFPRIAAAASLYGLNLVTEAEDSPHLHLDGIGSELYFGFAEIDPAVPDNVVPDLRAALDGAGANYRLETYAGVHHGFCFNVRPDYDAVAAERAWDTLMNLWERTLA